MGECSFWHWLTWAGQSPESRKLVVVVVVVVTAWVKKIRLGG